MEEMNFNVEQKIVDMMVNDYDFDFGAFGIVDECYCEDNEI